MSVSADTINVIDNKCSSSNLKLSEKAKEKSHFYTGLGFG